MYILTETNNRILFTTSLTVDEGFILPGTNEDPPEPILRANTVIDGIEYHWGSADPRFVKRDILKLEVGQYEDKQWYSFRYGTSMDTSTFGDITNSNPQVVNTITLEEFNHFAVSEDIIAVWSIDTRKNSVELTSEDVSNTMIKLGFVLDSSINISNTILYSANSYQEVLMDLFHASANT